MILSMKNIVKYLMLIILPLSISGCAEEWLDEPKSTTILLPEQVWNDPKMITSILANLYDRLPIHSAIHSGWQNYAAYDEGMAAVSADIDAGNNNLLNYSYDRWRLWDYTYIRDINLCLEGIDAYSKLLTNDVKTQFKAEFRFLRAYDYFEMVKRMGGVPIITKQLIYDYSGDASNLRYPRNKESEVYDFIASECDEIKDIVGNTGSKDRATKYAVLALKCRAMLYAGSIAKYNSLMSAPISTPGGEVGIPASKATGYYTAALNAAKEIINSGQYQLYNKNPNLGENFYEALTKKVNNPEMILAMDFNISKNKKHNFSYQNICRTMREDNLSSSSVVPPLNLVEDYEYLDGTPGTLKGVGDGTVAGQANWTYYTNLSDIFNNKDARLYGTVVYPGTSFKGVDVQMQAGVYEWNTTTNRYDRTESTNFGALYKDGKLLTGNGGPMRSSTEVSCTGFYIKKFIDPATLSSARGVGTDIQWVRFRYGEVLLNAAEAAFELGGANIPDALNYVNQVRQRAGFPPNSLTASTLTLARLQNERRVELCYEDHRTWDLARWRIATTVWDGQASNPKAVLYALFPYRVINSVDPTKNGKYVFDKFVAPKFVAPRFYQMGNYYSSISQTVLDNNPLIVKNPFH
jgi:starch-binding outer membrane protein, SusD/RagB family